MELSKDMVAQIVQEVLKKYQGSSGAAPSESASYGRGRMGIFTAMDEAVEAAHEARLGLAKLTLDTRRAIIESIRKKTLANVRLLAEMAVAETGMGRVEDKITKKTIVASKTPGLEDIVPKAYTGDGGLTLVERGAFGVIGSITPSTNPAATVINNSISMIAAGNAVVFNFHPSAKKVSQKALMLVNEAVQEAGGPANIVTTVENPSLQTGLELMKHKKVRLLAVTGGPEVVKTAMKEAGKRVIGAGPGNPPVVVDETADIDLAAREIVMGASFDNNIMCTCEKEVFCVDSVFDELIQKMQNAGAYLLNPYQTDQLTKKIIMPAKPGQVHPVANKQYMGKNAAIIAKSIGLDLPADLRLLICEVHKDHPLIYAEQMMPVLPLCRAKNVEEAIDLAIHAEHGFMHTASMFSRSVENLSRMAYLVNSTIFVKNAATVAGLGGRGEGHTSMTIAGPTGEGPTSARTFTRYRRCVLVDYFRII